MPYIAQARGGGSHVAQGSYVGSNPTYAAVYRDDWATKLEAVYSYRSSSPPNALASANANKRPGLGTRMREHWDQVESSVAMMDGVQGSPTHFLTKDVGHDFAKSTTECIVGRGKVSMVNALGNPYVFTGYAPIAHWPVSVNPLTGAVVTQTGGIPDHRKVFSKKGFASSIGCSSAEFMSTDLHNSTASYLIATMNPLKAKASLLATIVELVRGDVPKILNTLSGHMFWIAKMRHAYPGAQAVQNGLQAAKWVGGSSLNIQFGWAPIIRDVANAIKLMLQLDQMVFTPDTRRERRIPVSEWSGQLSQRTDWYARHPLWSVNVESSAPSFAYNSYTKSGLNPSGLSSTGVSLPTDWAFHGSVDMQVSARFSGNLVPTVRDNGWVDQATELLGLKLTPAVIWELTPWSWLVDWFSNLGTIVTNLSSLQMSNVVLNYAYATTVLRLQSSAKANRPTDSDARYITGVEPGVVASYTHVGKVRTAASPFGFGTSIGSLTATQWNILASLGLARRR